MIYRGNSQYNSTLQSYNGVRSGIFTGENISQHNSVRKCNHRWVFIFSSWRELPSGKDNILQSVPRRCPVRGVTGSNYFESAVSDWWELVWSGRDVNFGCLGCWISHPRAVSSIGTLARNTSDLVDSFLSLLVYLSLATVIMADRGVAWI